MVDRKTAKWVDKITARECQKNRKKYDLFGHNGYLVAQMVVSKRLYDCMGTESKKKKPDVKRFNFLADAYEYADRVSGWLSADDIKRAYHGEKYFKNEMWRGD